MSWNRVLLSLAAILLRALRSCAVVLAGVFIAVALLSGLRSLAVWDAISLAASGVVLGVMGVVCVACVRDVPLGAYVRAVAVAAPGILVVAGLFHLPWVFTLTAAGLATTWVLAALAARRLPSHRRQAAGPEPSPVVGATRSRAHTGPRSLVALPLDPAPLVPVVPVLPLLGISDTMAVSNTMTDLDLCRAWRSSFVALERAGNPASRARIAGTRAVLLDELERRHPSGFGAWIRSGARAAGGPERYVLGHEGARATEAGGPDGPYGPYGPADGVRD